jgi:hypothetical protein
VQNENVKQKRKKGKHKMAISSGEIAKLRKKQKKDRMTATAYKKAGVPRKGQAKKSTMGGGKTATKTVTPKHMKADYIDTPKKKKAAPKPTRKPAPPTPTKTTVDKSPKIAGAKVTKKTAGPFDKEPERKRGLRYKGKPKSSRQPFGGASGFKSGGKIYRVKKSKKRK